MYDEITFTGAIEIIFQNHVKSSCALIGATFYEPGQRPTEFI